MSEKIKEVPGLVDYDSGAVTGHAGTTPWLDWLREAHDPGNNRLTTHNTMVVPSLEEIREMIDGYNKMYGTNYKLVRKIEKYEPVFEEEV